MGFFSWKTSNTDKSIPCVHSNRDPLKVRMYDDKGNIYEEPAYDGYGVFGGKDYYQLLLEMNFPGECNGDVDHDRSLGIDKFYRDNYDLRVPKLLEVTDDIPEDPIEAYEKYPDPENCPNQGFFYDDDEEEEEDEGYSDDTLWF